MILKFFKTKRKTQWWQCDTQKHSFLGSVSKQHVIDKSINKQKSKRVVKLRLRLIPPVAQTQRENKSNRTSYLDRNVPDYDDRALDREGPPRSTPVRRI